MSIQSKGADVLNEEELFQFNKILDSHYEKIKRALKNDVDLIVKLKRYENNGGSEKAHRYSVEMDVRTNSGKITSNNTDWDLNRTLHGAFRAIENEIEKKFHVSDQHDKLRKPAE